MIPFLRSAFPLLFVFPNGVLHPSRAMFAFLGAYRNVFRFDCAIYHGFSFWGLVYLLWNDAIIIPPRVLLHALQFNSAKDDVICLAHYCSTVSWRWLIRRLAARCLRFFEQCLSKHGDTYWIFCESRNPRRSTGYFLVHRFSFRNISIYRK